MTNAAINHALAEALGYRVVYDPTSGPLWDAGWELRRADGALIDCGDTEAQTWALAPDFCQDWAAMGELWAWLNGQGLDVYMESFQDAQAAAQVDAVFGYGDIPPLALARAAVAWLQAREAGP